MLLATTWMDLECIILSEISYAEKEKLYLYMESKRQMNKHNKWKQSYRYREQTGVFQSGGGKERNR